MPAFLKKRDNILVLVFGVVLAFFIGRMLQMQLIQGDEYESQIYKGTIKTQTVEAARGEMTDRYGNPIVTNRVSMNLTLVGRGRELFLSAITSGGSQAMFFKINTWGEEAFLDTLRAVADGL